MGYFWAFGEFRTRLVHGTALIPECGAEKGVIYIFGVGRAICSDVIDSRVSLFWYGQVQCSYTRDRALVKIESLKQVVGTCTFSCHFETS